MRKSTLVWFIILIYLLIGVIFGTASFKEREGYASLGSRIGDFIFSLFFWPFSLFANLNCHGGDISKILQGCTMLPPGL